MRPWRAGTPSSRSGRSASKNTASDTARPASLTRAGQFQDRYPAISGTSGRREPGRALALSRGMTLRRIVIGAALLAGLALAASGAGGDIATARGPADGLTPAFLVEQAPSRLASSEVNSR